MADNNNNNNNDGLKLEKSEKNKHKTYKRLIKYINYIPRIIIYTVCAYLFLYNSRSLIGRYLRYETIVMVKYQAPEKIQFPAFTICGCCIEQIIQNDTAEKISDREMKLLKQYTVKEIIEQISYNSTKLIKSCTVVMDSKENMLTKCSDTRPILSSIYNGRKCFTYLSTLNDKNFGDDDDNNNYNDKMIDNNDRYTAYINVELNFPTSVSIGSTLHDNTLQNADIIIAIHPPNLLPTMLDTEFYRIDPNNLYEIQFTKEVTKLKEEPYRTNCTKYNPFDRQSEINSKFIFNVIDFNRISILAPRSRNECVNLCILRESLNNKNDQQQQQQQKCIYYHNVISSYMLNYFEGKLDTMNAKFCTSRNYLSYVNFTKIRSQCYKDCHPDCIEENYKTTIDVSIIDDDDDNDNDDGKIFTSAVGPFLIDERFFATGFNSRDNSIETANVNKKQTKSMIIIWPNREMYREVEHEGEINFFELIGCLGGHAHIWLGLSIIQFYDVFADLISRIRYSWELIRQKFQFIQKIYPKQRKPYNRCRPFSTSLNHQR